MEISYVKTTHELEIHAIYKKFYIKSSKQSAITCVQCTFMQCMLIYSYYIIVITYLYCAQKCYNSAGYAQ